MGVQQHRRSKARTRTRRSALMKLESPKYSACPQCHEPKAPHKVCPECGYYKDRVVVAKAE